MKLAVKPLTALARFRYRFQSLQDSAFSSTNIVLLSKPNSCKLKILFFFKNIGVIKL